MKKKEHIVKTVKPGSIAEELEIAPGDKVLAIDNTEIEDIFDYQFLTQDTYIEMLVEKPDGEQWLLGSTRNLMRIWASNLRTV